MKIKLIALTFALITLPLFAESLFISSYKGTLYTSPLRSSTKTATLKRGTEIKVTEKSGRWLLVSTGSQKGWIQQSFTAKSKPTGKISILGNAKRTSRMKARQRASSDVTAASARGFMQDSKIAGRTRANSAKDTFNPEDMDYIDTISVSEDELLSFLAEGGLQN